MENTRYIALKEDIADLRRCAQSLRREVDAATARLSPLLGFYRDLSIRTDTELGRAVQTVMAQLCVNGEPYQTPAYRA